MQTWQCSEKLGLYGKNTVGNTDYYIGAGDSGHITVGGTIGGMVIAGQYHHIHSQLPCHQRKKCLMMQLPIHLLFSVTFVHSSGRYASVLLRVHAFDITPCLCFFQSVCYAVVMPLHVQQHHEVATDVTLACHFNKTPPSLRMF